MSGEFTPQQLERMLERISDGRNVDLAVGELSGEAAAQQVRHPERGAAVQGVSAQPATGAASEQATPDYYGQPCIKEPVWIWTIPTYFYVGGAAGAASALGAAVEVLGGPGLRGLGGRCRWVGTVGDMVGAGLLIADLGRPARFLHMLRVFRPTSPMSMGSWLLAGSGALNTASLVLRGRHSPLGSVAALLAGALGLPLSGYTAVLLSNSAVPLWQAVRRPLPLLFMASAAASAASLLALWPGSRQEERTVRAFGLAGRAAELLASHQVEQHARRMAVIGRPLVQGRAGNLWKAARACSVAGLALGLLPSRWRWATLAASVLTSAGSLAMRMGLFYAGKHSSRDPQATFQPQRQGLGAAESLGHELASDGRPLRYPLPVV